MPNGIDYGFAHAPGANAKASLREIINQKLVRLDAPIGAAMMQELGPVLRAERNAAYRDWLQRIAVDDAAKSVTPVMGTIDPRDLGWLAKNDKPQPATAEIGISSAVINGPKAVRHTAKGDALAVGIWEAVPDMLEEPLAVLFDEANGTLIYVLPEASSKRPQLAVAFDYRRNRSDVNMLISAYRPGLADLQERVRNGTLKLMRGLE